MENARVSRAMGTFYDVLGVRRDSAADEIKQAYHRLALEYHPDKNSSSAAAEKMKEINEAYRVLGDAKLRAEYDAKAFRSAGDNLYARWYRPSPGGFKQGPGTTGRHAWAESAEAASMGYEAPRRTTVYKSAAFISREHLVASAKVGLAFGIAIAFLILSADTIQQKYGVGVIVSLAAAAATAFLTSFVSVLLLRDELKNKAEAGVSGSAALAVALFVAWLAWAFFYSGTGPDWGWCLTCFGAPVLCGIAGWLIGRFVGQRTWDVFRG